MHAPVKMEQAAMPWQGSAFVLRVIRVSTVTKVLVPIWCKKLNKSHQHLKVCLLRATSSIFWALWISWNIERVILYLLHSWVFSFPYKLTNLVLINRVKVLVSMLSCSNEFHMLLIKNKFLALILNLLLKFQVRLLNWCMSSQLSVMEWSAKEF